MFPVQERQQQRLIGEMSSKEQLLNKGASLMKVSFGDHVYISTVVYEVCKTLLYNILC